MDWIGEIEKHAGALGRPTIFKDAMTTLSFRLEESLKEDVNLLAEYLTRRLESKSSAGAVARAFIASGLEQMRAQSPIYRSFWNSGESRITIRASFRKHSRQGAKSRRRRK
jgi:hypothetical protein